MSKTIKKADGDIVLKDSDGRAYWVEGIEKLSQDSADALMTEYDSRRGFGSLLTDNLFTNSPEFGGFGMITRGRIKSMVRDAVERLRDLQTKRPDQLSGFEAISDIGAIRVFQVSKTGYVFFVDIHPFAGPDKLTTSFTISLRHQLPPGARPNLPGSIVTDDTRTF
jgi:hypothetical protein|tara:strand:+ start:170563 stop:171060 length:498 start_codon:yes stop_codon:yes gene_type:complete